MPRGVHNLPVYAPETYSQMGCLPTSLPPKNGHDCRRQVDRAGYYRVAHCAHYTTYSFVLLLGTLAANFTATRGDEAVRASEMFSPVLSRRFDYLCRLKRKSNRGVKGMPTIVAERKRV